MTQPALEFGHIDKSFFGAKVLKDISFAVPSGAIVGLVGENGAGKSTLVNILSGIFPADAGWMKLNGIPFTPQRPVDSAQAGIALAHQELNLFPNLSVAENLFIAEFPKQGPESLSWIDRENLRSAASELLKQVNLDVEPGTLVEELSPGQKQLLEIAKALKGDPLVVAFDEPTTSLTRPEAEQLFTIIRRLKERGIGVIYISHNLGDVMRLCD
ncbi:MAG TPA: ATP-binding cassette domain-containing protein, partial [Acidobacteriota bacterium]|nr:ATP-binding cassette domain-containing protein [Acidobacteriota bacterium]